MPRTLLRHTVTHSQRPAQSCAAIGLNMHWLRAHRIHNFFQLVLRLPTIAGAGPGFITSPTTSSSASFASSPCFPFFFPALALELPPKTLLQRVFPLALWSRLSFPHSTYPSESYFVECAVFWFVLLPLCVLLLVSALSVVASYVCS